MIYLKDTDIIWWQDQCFTKGIDYANGSFFSNVEKDFDKWNPIRRSVMTSVWTIITLQKRETKTRLKYETLYLHNNK